MRYLGNQNCTIGIPRDQKCAIGTWGIKIAQLKYRDQNCTIMILRRIKNTIKPSCIFFFSCAQKPRVLITLETVLFLYSSFSIFPSIICETYIYSNSYSLFVTHFNSNKILEVNIGKIHSNNLYTDHKHKHKRCSSICSEV